MFQVCFYSFTPWISKIGFVFAGLLEFAFFFHFLHDFINPNWVICNRIHDCNIHLWILQMRLDFGNLCSRCGTSTLLNAAWGRSINADLLTSLGERFNPLPLLHAEFSFLIYIRGSRLCFLDLYISNHENFVNSANFSSLWSRSQRLL